jgi:hypothetical protein
MIFEVLWTVDAVLRLLESYYCKVDKIIVFFFLLEWETPEITGKTRVFPENSHPCNGADHDHNKYWSYLFYVMVLVLFH